MTRRPALALVLQPLPWTSPMRRMWAGTKLSGLCIVALASVFAPGWGAVWALLGLLALAALTTRVPLSVVPVPPLWAVALLLVGAGTAALGSGLDLFVQGAVIAVGLVALGVVVSWTTPAAELADAVATLLSPLGRLGAPSGTWAATAALTVRSLPLIAADLQVILDVRRLRRPDGAQRPTRIAVVRGSLRDGVDFAVTAFSVAARRGRDVGAAVAARGGVRPLTPRRPRLGWPDLAALLVVAAVVAVTVTVP